MSDNIDMKNRYYANYIILSIVFFLILSAVTIFSINQKYKSGNEKGVTYFNKIKSNITTLYLSQEDFTSPLFKKNVNNIFSSDNSLQSIIISDNTGRIEYLYIKNQNIIAGKPVYTPDFITRPVYDFSSLFFKLISESVILPGNNSFNIEIVYRVIDFSALAYIIKINIICILLYIIITVFSLLFIPVSKKSVDTTEKKSAEEDKVEDKTVIKRQEVVKMTAESQPIDDAMPAENDMPQPVLPLENISSEKIQTVKETGLSWYDYFGSKLSSELDKAASFDTDITLLIVNFKCSEKSKTEKLYAELPVLLQSFFMPESSFEYGKNSFAVIIPDSSLEESLPKINAFIVRLKHSSDIEDIFAGISSRNSRIISSNRLVSEAEGALSKAVSESGSPVIAFRSDPEKFREMISNQHLN